VPAPACMQCAANLPQQPLRRGCFRLTTVSSLRSSDGHACGSKAAAAARCRPARYRLMRQKRVGVQPSGACVHVTTSCYHASHVACCTSQAIVGVAYNHTLIALTLQLGAGGDEMMEVQSTACMHFCSVAATRRNSIALAAAAIGRQAACCSRYSPLKRKPQRLHDVSGKVCVCVCVFVHACVCVCVHVCVILSLGRDASDFLAPLWDVRVCLCVRSVRLIFVRFCWVPRYNLRTQVCALRCWPACAAR
jgi:hypothetical protein